MSATRGNGEHWKSLESVGISRKELALAEALQMEYDALSRLRQDKEESRAKQRAEPPLISWDEPENTHGCTGIKATRGLSGSDPALCNNALPEGLTPGLPVPPPRPNAAPAGTEGPAWLKTPLAGDYLYIFDGSEGDFLGEPLNGTSALDSDGGSPKKLSPPPLPPRHSVRSHPEGSRRLGKGSPPSSKGSQPRDVNVFSAHEQPRGKLLARRISEEDPYGLADYEGINDAITCLNLKSTYESQVLREAARGWKEGRSIFEKESSGKPVARSKTMPPQVPPRTYVSRFGNRKNVAPNKNRRISADPVRGCSLPADGSGVGDGCVPPPSPAVPPGSLGSECWGAAVGSWPQAQLPPGPCSVVGERCSWWGRCKSPTASTLPETNYKRALKLSLVAAVFSAFLCLPLAAGWVNCSDSGAIVCC